MTTNKTYPPFLKPDSKHISAFTIQYLFVLVIFSIMVFGCNPKPLHLRADYHKKQSSKTVTRVCCFKLASITDDRSNKDSLGKIGGRKVLHDELEDWLKNGLASIGIEAVVDNDETRPVIEVEVEAEHIYGRSVTTSMTCNVVLKIRFSYESDILDEKIYRGTHVALNWISGDSEIQECFNLALKDAMKKVLTDANTICHILTTRKSP